MMMMKRQLIGLLMLFGLSAMVHSWRDPGQLGDDFGKANENLQESWRKFKREFKREHGDNVHEEMKRYQIFAKNYLEVVEHNAKFDRAEVTFRRGINHFSDMTQEEIRQMMGIDNLNNNRMRAEMLQKMSEEAMVEPELEESQLKQIPDSIDWRTKGAVTPVRYQGRCGSCFSFAAVSTVESQVFLKYNTLYDLSKQQLVDCRTDNWGNSGCNGGSIYKAYNYLRENRGIDTEAAYPYVSGDTGIPNPSCLYNASASVARVTGFTQSPQYDEDKLKQNIALYGPYAVSIDAWYGWFYSYRSGVYDYSSCTGKANHGLSVVGYGSLPMNVSGTITNVDYWLCKNSWGDWWGDGGYIRMRRNANNQCAIASWAYRPLIA